MLLPTKVVALRLAFDDSADAATQRAWRSQIVARLSEEGVRVADDGAPPAVPVDVSIDVMSSPGTTDAGTEFWAARATGVVALGRVRADLTGRHAVADTAADAEAAARADLVEKITRFLAW